MYARVSLYTSVGMWSHRWWAGPRWHKRQRTQPAGDAGESSDSDPDNILPAARHWARKEEKKTEGCMAAGLRCNVWARAQSPSQPPEQTGAFPPGLSPGLGLPAPAPCIWWQASTACNCRLPFGVGTAGGYSWCVLSPPAVLGCHHWAQGLAWRAVHSCHSFREGDAYLGKMPYLYILWLYLCVSACICIYDARICHIFVCIVSVSVSICLYLYVWCTYLHVSGNRFHSHCGRTTSFSSRRRPTIEERVPPSARRLMPAGMAGSTWFLRCVSSQTPGVLWSVSAPWSRPCTTTAHGRAGLGGPAPRKSGPSCCICPLLIPLCTLFRSRTSSAVCPFSLRETTARFQEACHFARTPVFQGAPATAPGVRGPAAPCSTSTRGPWSGPLTTRRWRGRRSEKNKFLFLNWKCVLHRTFQHHGQSHRLSGTPLAYPQADIPVYTCRYKQIQCLYMQIQDIHADT